MDAVGVLLAQYLPYAMAIGAVVFIIRFQGQRARTLLLIEAILAVVLSRGIITELIRFFYHHPRPFAALGFESLIPESGWSFPSGHAAAYFALATILFLFNTEWGILYYGLAFINGLARIYAGVHWPLDIVGGIIVGTASAAIIHALLKKHREKILEPA